MTDSYWNDSNSQSDKGRTAAEDNVSRRYYPAVESAPLKPPPYYSNVARFSEHVACAKKPPPPHTVESKEYTTASQPKDPSSPVIKAVGSSSSAETIATSPSTSDSSFLESLRAEPASCCPLCGFQAIPTSTSSSSTNSARESLKAAALASSTNSDLPSSVWLRSLVVKQQEELIKRCHSTESSSGVASIITDASTPFPNKGLSSETCWVCLDAANKAAKEKQVEEDRLLAASLSEILLEEQQNCSNGSDIGDDAIGIHRQITSINDYPISHDSATQYQQREIIQQEWSGQGHASVATIPTSVVVRDGQNCNFQSGEISSKANDDSCVYIGEYNVLGQRDGHGELIWDHGDRYVGTFQNGMRSGQGTFFFRDGSEYTGDWKDDLIHGLGQHKFANGDIYVGKYHKGQRSGEQCKYKFANSDLYVGGWEKDHFHGFGRYFYADGSVLEGKYCHGIKQGKFKRQLPTEDLDILRFEDDKVVDKGVRWNTKRTKTWLLETRNSPDEAGTAKSKARSTALRVVRGIGGLKLSRHRKKANKNIPSSVGTVENNSMVKEEDGNQNFTKSNGSPAPVSPQKSTKNLVKKSVRIPISQAVSIGYDCEIGTGKQNVSVTVE